MLEHRPGFFLILLCTIPNVGTFVKPHRDPTRRDMSHYHQLPSQGNETRSSNVTLPIEQWRWIDQKHTDIIGTWGSAKKNVIIRAALTIAMESDPDLTGCNNEDEITERLRQAIIQQGSSVEASAFERRSRLLQSAVSAIMVADMADTAVIEQMIEQLVQTLRQPRRE
jgi:hypothetical protein